MNDEQTRTRFESLLLPLMNDAYNLARWLRGARLGGIYQDRPGSIARRLGYSALAAGACAALARDQPARHFRGGRRARPQHKAGGIGGGRGIDCGVLRASGAARVGLFAAERAHPMR